MNQELCWLLLPITGLLSQIGGTWWKAARRYGIPIVTVITLSLFCGWDYKYILVALHLFGSYCLPITKFGDSIPGDWRNWLWVPLWATILCSSVLWLNFYYYVVPCLICAMILALFVILSNVKATAKWFQWKMVEIFEGLFPIIPLCYFITMQ